MARLTLEAERQVNELAEHYLRKDRIEAVLRLSDAVEAAIQAVDNPSASWLSFPRPYPELAVEGFRWIKQHRYWFAYTADAGETLIHHVIYDRSDIVNRVRGPRS